MRNNFGIHIVAHSEPHTRFKLRSGARAPGPARPRPPSPPSAPLSPPASGLSAYMLKSCARGAKNSRGNLKCAVKLNIEVLELITYKTTRLCMRDLNILNYEKHQLANMNLRDLG